MNIQSTISIFSVVFNFEMGFKCFWKPMIYFYYKKHLFDRGVSYFEYFFKNDFAFSHFLCNQTCRLHFFIFFLLNYQYWSWQLNYRAKIVSSKVTFRLQTILWSCKKNSWIIINSITPFDCFSYCQIKKKYWSSTSRQNFEFTNDKKIHFNLVMFL